MALFFQGRPKLWVIVPGRFKDQVEKHIEKKEREVGVDCRAPWRHKRSLLLPQFLSKVEVKTTYSDYIYLLSSNPCYILNLQVPFEIVVNWHSLSLPARFTAGSTTGRTSTSP